MQCGLCYVTRTKPMHEPPLSDASENISCTGRDFLHMYLQKKAKLAKTLHFGMKIFP